MNDNVKRFSVSEFDTLQQQVIALVKELKSVAEVASEITQTLYRSKTQTPGDVWVEAAGGETMTKAAAARQFGISVSYLNKLINEGSIQTAPDDRVLVRSAAAWANSSKRKRVNKTPGFRVEP